MTAFIEPYSVHEMYPEVAASYKYAPSDWTEYTATLLDKDGDIIDEWDSLGETFNGLQFLTPEEMPAIEAMIKADIPGYFTLQ